MRTTAHFFLTILLLTAALGRLEAAAFSPPLGDNPNFTRLMMDADQTVGEVQAIREDKYGFIWIGGKTGLARYDGYRFKIFVNNSKDEHSLSANFVRDIFEDSKERLWISTENGGVMLYNRDMENFDRIGYTAGSFPGERGEVFYRMMEDSEHRIWFCGNHGVSEYDETQHKIAQHLINSPLDNYIVNNLVQFSDDEFAIATSGGMFYWNRRSNTLLQLQHDDKNPRSLSHNELRDILLDSYHNIWVATDKGISRYRPETKDFDNIIIPNANPRIDGTPVWSLYEDNKRMIWLATDGNGVMYFDPVSRKMGAYTSGASYASLSRAVTRRVYQDRSGDYWIGMFPIGVSHFDNSNNYISLYNNFIRNKEGMFRNQVWAIQEDDDGNLWLGVDDLGLVYFDRHNNTFSQSYHGLDFSAAGFPRSVLSLLKDDHGNLWFGSWAEGIGRLNLRTLHYDLFKTPHNGDPRTVFPAKHVWSFLQSRTGEIYIGSMGDGVVTYSYKTDEFSARPQTPATPEDERLASGNIWFMREDQQGHIWIATSAGFAIYDPATGKLKKYRANPSDPKSLSHEWVTSFLFDSKGRTWVTTMGGGLNLWHPRTESFTHYRAEDGIGTDGIQGIIEDKSGLLWLSTRAGLASFDVEKNTFTRYTDKNWLQKGEFNTGAFTGLRSGELAFGGVSGFNVFNPGNVSTNNYVAPVYFTELQLFDKFVNPSTDARSPLKRSLITSDSITLDYDQDVFSLVFTTLNYRVWADNQYRYILDGFDDHWHAATDNNRVTYTRLGAGTYVLRVHASNNTGLWTEHEKTLQIVVLPAPWRTWWAYTLYALLVLSIVAWYIHSQRSKIRQAALLNAKLVELDKIKDNFMANTSHELRTPVNGILGMAQALRDGDDPEEQLPHGAREKLDVILSCGRRLSRLINDILDFTAISESQLLLKPRCVNLHVLLPQVIEECHIQHTNAAITVENQLPSNLPLVYADEARVTNIFYNIISNAFKFTEKGFVRLSATVTEKQVSIKIADTGVGIDKEDISQIFSSFSQVANSGVNRKNGTGLGLAITKYLIERHGGSLTVESTKGVGSVFTVSLPRATEQQMAEHHASLTSPKTATDLSAEPAASGPQVETKLPVFYPKSHAENPDQYFSRILVVDDEPVNRMVLRHMLLRRNYIVYEATNGEEVVEAIDHGFTCDLILLDIMMPKLSGLEACKIIRSKHSAESLPIIFVTAKTQQQDRDECLAVGGNDFITKPVANDDLCAHMDKVMAHHS